MNTHTKTLFYNTVRSLTKAWDKGTINGPTYASAVATLTMFLGTKDADTSKVSEWVHKVIDKNHPYLIR